MTMRAEIWANQLELGSSEDLSVTRVPLVNVRRNIAQIRDHVNKKGNVLRSHEAVIAGLEKARSSVHAHRSRS